MLQKLLDALIDIVLFFPRLIFAGVVEMIEVMLTWLPEIEVMDLQSLFNNLGGQILYFLTVFEFGYGLTAIMTALLARFVLRRIPFIG
ncbi:DUF2523 family protein [Marinobacter salarius]|jgi:hypothetical protein|uniref:DUF2523 family protein n=1 Tax=Marinobacter salarius TaxID=1420917 RepID=UPI003D9C53D8